MDRRACVLRVAVLRANDDVIPSRLPVLCSHARVDVMVLLYAPRTAMITPWSLQGGTSETQSLFVWLG